MQMQNVDVVIVGGGMVGLGLAAALKESGLKIAIVEGQLPEPQLGEAPDNRVSALSLASQRILQQVGAWTGIEARRLQPYEKMQVWEQDSFGQIGFDAASLRQAALGHIVENRVIQLALLEAILDGMRVLLQLTNESYGQRIVARLGEVLPEEFLPQLDAAAHRVPATAPERGTPPQLKVVGG